MTDTAMFVTACTIVSRLSFDQLSTQVLEASVKYQLVPSDTHKNQLLVATSMLLLKNVLAKTSVEELTKKIEFLNLLTLTPN
jgi:hypothetical protein